MKMGGTRIFQGRKTFHAAHEKALPTAGRAASKLQRAAARAAAAAAEPLLAGHAHAWCGGWANVQRPHGRVHRRVAPCTRTQSGDDEPQVPNMV